jgi:hypothetical protein
VFSVFNILLKPQFKTFHLDLKILEHAINIKGIKQSGLI